MSAFFPNGTVFALSSVFGSPATITAISNASTGVATAAAHGFTDGDIVLLDVASSRLANRVVRVDNAATGAFDLEGIDTTSTTKYPTGFGVGTAKEATTFVSVSQTVEVSTTGGEQQFYQWVYLEDGRQRQRPTFKNARALNFTYDWDADLAWHATLVAADEDGDVKVLRATLPTGDVFYWAVYVGFDGEPSFTINENMKTTATMSLANPSSTRYAA